MCESGSAVALDMQRIPWGGQEHVVKTTSGPISVFLCGDQGKPPLITYPDVALNYMSCFQGFFFCPEASSLIFRNFCIYHIDAPGHELGAAAISSEQPKLTVDGLADQVAQVLDYFGLQEVTCMGVTAGAYILTLFAMKYPKRVQGLILVSPLCQAPSWTEWFYNKLIINLLHYHGMCGMVKETLLQRYFSKDLRALSGAESDIVEACRRLLDERQSRNVGRFLDAMNRRKDLSDSLKELKCRTLIFVGEKSPFHNDALHFSHAMDTQYNALVEVQACGSLVTEEQPLSMLVPLDYFLMQYAFYKPLPPSGRHGSPVSPLSPLCISPELLSPESLGLKLKPIKTRVAVEDRHLHASILPIFGKRQP